MGQRDASSKLSVQQSVVHYFKINRPRGKWQWTFLGLVTLQIIFGVAMEGTILVFTRNALEYIDLTLFPDFFTSKDLTGLKSVQAQFEQNTSPLVVVHLLFIFTLALQIVYTYDALARRNTLQIVGIIILNLYLVIWSVLTFMSTDSLFNALTTFRGGILTVDAEAAFTNNIRVASISIIAIIAVISVALVAIFVVSLYKQFGWATYDALGADPEIKMYNRDAEILYTLLKFDYKFYVSTRYTHLHCLLLDHMGRHHRHLRRATTLATTPFDPTDHDRTRQYSNGIEVRNEEIDDRIHRRRLSRLSWRHHRFNIQLIQWRLSTDR